MRTRTIVLHIDDETREGLSRRAGEHAHAALYYLNTWSLSRYPHVTIYVAMSEGLPELHAAYRDDPDCVTSVTLHGFWNPATETFGFHS